MLKRLSALTYWQWLIICACATPILMVVLALVEQGQRLPYYDDWDTAYDVALASLNGQLTLDSLFRFHNEHPIVFTKLTQAASAVFLHWNLTAILSVNILLSLGCALLFLRLVALDFGDAIAFTVAIPVFIILFTLRAWHHWIVGLQNVFGFVLFFFILSVYLLRAIPVSWPALLLALIAAACATFSLGNGVLVWLPLLLVVVGRGYRRPLHLLAWFGGMGAVLLLYAHYAGMAAASGTVRAPVLEFLLNLQWVYGFVLLIASPLAVYNAAWGNLAASIPPTVIVGAMCLALFTANSLFSLADWRRHRVLKSKAPVWVAITLFSLLSIASVVYGRTTGQFAGNIAALLSGRYVPLTFFFWAVFVVMLVYQLSLWAKQGRQIGNTVRIVFNSILLVGVLGLMIAAMRYSSVSLDLQRETFEACHHRYVYFALPVNCHRYEIPPESTRRWDERLMTLANRGLALYAEPSLSIPLTINPTPNVEEQTGRGYAGFSYWSDRAVPTSIFLAAPGRIRYPHVYLPTSHPYAEFRTDLYVPVEAPDPAADGVRYRVRVLDGDEQTLAEVESVYNPNVNVGLVPLTLDLTPYIGQTVMLELATDGLENALLDDSAWIEPRLHFWR